MILNEQKLSGEEEVSKETAGRLDAAKTHDVRQGSDGKWYAKKKVKSDKKRGEEEVSKDTAARLDSASPKTHDVRQGSDGKWYAKKKSTSPSPEDGDDKKDPWKDTKLPFKKTAESDAFRAWLLSKFPSYGDESAMSKTFAVSKPPSKFMTSEALKNAYYQKGEMYEIWVKDGGKVDPTTFAVTEPSGQVVVGGGGVNLPPGQNVVKMKGCQSVGNNSRFRELATDTTQLNDLVSDFISWWKNSTGKTNFVTPGTCGITPSAPSLWINNVLYDENGNEYYAWQSSIINDLTREKVTLPDGQTVTRFDIWLKNRQERLEKYRKSLDNSLLNVNTNVKTNVVNNNDYEKLKYAAEIVKKDTDIPLRKNCVFLKKVLDSSNFDYKDADIKAQIYKCQKPYNKLMTKESIENKITGKLKLMKENKQLTEKVSDKLKTKKLEKISENFSKQNYRKFFDTLTKFRNNNINEATNTEFEKSFDVIFQGKETEFKNRAIEYILGKLEVSPSSELGKSIKSELDRVPAKDMFRNEYDVPEAISKAIETSSQSNNGEQTGLKGIVSQSIKFDDKQIKQGVRQHLHDYIEGVKDDIKSLEQKLKSSIVKSL